MPAKAERPGRILVRPSALEDRLIRLTDVMPVIHQAAMLKLAAAEALLTERALRGRLEGWPSQIPSLCAEVTSSSIAGTESEPQPIVYSKTRWA